MAVLPVGAARSAPPSPASPAAASVLCRPPVAYLSATMGVDHRDRWRAPRRSVGCMITLETGTFARSICTGRIGVSDFHRLGIPFPLADAPALTGSSVTAVRERFGAQARAP